MSGCNPNGTRAVPTDQYNAPRGGEVVGLGPIHQPLRYGHSTPYTTSNGREGGGNGSVEENERNNGSGKGRGENKTLK